MTKKKKRKILLGPVITILILTFIIIFSSAIFSLLEVQGEKAEIIRGTIETSLITVNNVLTKDGIKYFIGSVITNFQAFKPLMLLIISLIAISIGEASGLFKAFFTPLKRIKPFILTATVLFIGIVSSFIGEYSYTLLLPLVAIIYKHVGQKPLLGILTVFLGITIGYGTGILYTYDDLILGELTTLSATINVDKNYVFNPSSTLYITIASTIILTFIGTIIIHKVLDKKIPKSNIEEEELKTSKEALYFSGFAFLALMIIVVYMIVPNLYGSGILLGEGKTYVEQLFGPTSPFRDGIIFIIVIIMMICGFIYGYISKNIKNSNEYSVALSKNFEDLGYVFVLLFFTSQMVSLLEWTNIGDVIGAKLITFMGTLSFSGMPLIIVMFLVIVLMGFLMPSLSAKWLLASPVLIPLFMRSNITPDFTQFIFRAADGVGKVITPMFVYYIIMLAFLEKYNTKENNKITIFGTIRILTPSILLFAGLWLLIIIGWYIVGLPLGPETYPTL